MSYRLLALLPALLTGCITVYSPPPPQAPQPAAVPSPLPPPQAQSAEDKLTIAETIQLCKRVQAAQELPIGCSVTYLEGKPAMFVGFGDLHTANEYWGALAEGVTKPFCQAANDGNREAFLFVALLDTESGRLFSCETGDWSDWFSYADETL